MAELSTWLDAVSEELGITDVELDNNSIHTLLDLARDSAHEVERLAAPLTAFLVGVAVGRGDSLGGAAAKVTALALTSAAGVRRGGDRTRSADPGRERLTWVTCDGCGCDGRCWSSSSSPWPCCSSTSVSGSCVGCSERETRNATTISNEQAPVRPYEQVFTRAIVDADQWQRVTATGTFDGAAPVRRPQPQQRRGPRVRGRHAAADRHRRRCWSTEASSPSCPGTGIPAAGRRRRAAR